MKNFKELKVWEKSHILALNVYHETSSFPKEEVYAMTSQIRRACVSIPGNLAEGCGRNRDSELYRFSEIAMGSASELEYLLLLAHDLNYLGHSEYSKLSKEVTEVKRMLASFIRKLKADR